MASIQNDVGSPEFTIGKAPPTQRMTEEEFVAWMDEDTRAEWVDGEVVVMAAASWIHVQLSQFLEGILGGYVRARHLGQVASREFAVRLSSKRLRLPDVLFVANQRLGNLRQNHLEGPPNLIVEVVSPDSIVRDWREKYLEYQDAGVDEYWIIDPAYQRAEAYSLGADMKYRPLEFVQGRILSLAAPGFYLRPGWLCQDPLPEVTAVLSELLAESKPE